MASLTEQQESDFDWFMDKRKDLFNEYGYSFVVIENKKVIKVYKGFDSSTELKALDEMYALKSPGTYLVQGLTDDEKYYYGAVRCASYV